MSPYPFGPWHRTALISLAPLQYRQTLLPYQNQGRTGWLASVKKALLYFSSWHCSQLCFLFPPASYVTPISAVLSGLWYHSHPPAFLDRCFNLVISKKNSSAQFWLADFTHKSPSHPCHSIMRNGISFQEYLAIFFLEEDNSLKGAWLTYAQLTRKQSGICKPGSSLIFKIGCIMYGTSPLVSEWCPCKASPWRKKRTL